MYKLYRPGRISHRPAFRPIVIPELIQSGDQLFCGENHTERSKLYISEHDQWMSESESLGTFESRDKSQFFLFAHNIRYCAIGRNAI